MADGATLVLALGAFLAGFVVGASGPLFVISVVPFVAGPTWGGLVLLAAVVLGALSSLVVFVGVMAGHRSYLGTAVVVACAALIAGIVTGAWYGKSVRPAAWADTHATPQPTRTWTMPPLPMILEAHADVTLDLDIGPDFVRNPTTGGPDGTFGHRCQSGPGTTEVADVSAMDVARLGAATVWADLQLTNQAMIDIGSAITFPRVVLQIRYGEGRDNYEYSGPARIVTSDARTGRAVFDALAPGPPPGYPAVVSGELTWACGPWTSP